MLTLMLMARGGDGYILLRRYDTIRFNSIRHVIIPFSASRLWVHLTMF